MRLRAYFILAVMPLFFVSNLIFGRPAVESVPPWTLATLRWTISCAVVAPFVLPLVRRHLSTIMEQWRIILLLGFLGMWVCGGLVYWSLLYTTATNGTLIYTAAPVLVVLADALLSRRPLPKTQAIGVLLGLLGVFTVVLKGDPMALLHLRFNIGDIGFIASTIGWATYSLLLRQTTMDRLPTAALFFVIALCGAALLLPFMVSELALGAPFPTTTRAWLCIAGIVVFASILSFSSYQYGVKYVGPAVTSAFLYLLPCYGVALAAIFLGEELHVYHAVGLALVMAGILLVSSASLRDLIVAHFKTGA
ncbi:MAG TPA: DMT family transporter [Pseudorhodoplanes sp.]|jgi:drug/metabolite transporter (DMT)-like permease|nr:DMT family transporter [Pseudorhodoplanes sp.]